MIEPLRCNKCGSHVWEKLLASNKIQDLCHNCGNPFPYIVEAPTSEETKITPDSKDVPTP